MSVMCSQPSVGGGRRVNVSYALPVCGMREVRVNVVNAVLDPWAGLVPSRFTVGR